MIFHEKTSPHDLHKMTLVGHIIYCTSAHSLTQLSFLRFEIGVITSSSSSQERFLEIEASCESLEYFSSSLNWSPDLWPLDKAKFKWEVQIQKIIIFQFGLISVDISNFLKQMTTITRAVLKRQRRIQFLG